MGAKDFKGIYQYTEDDDEATFSELLNLGMQSVSDSLAYFAGTAAQRAALTPPPDGALWQDTDDDHQLYSAGPTGEWRLHAGKKAVSAGSWANSNAPAYSRTVSVVLPTVLTANEDIAVSMTATPGYAFISKSAITRGVSDTTIELRHSQFHVNSTTAFEFTWWIVPGAV